MKINEELDFEAFLMDKFGFPINHKDELNEETFKNLLKYLNIELTYDVITKRSIVEGLPKKYASAEHIKVLPIYIMDSLRKNGIKVSKALIEDYLALEFASNNINPIKKLLESNIWDKKDRINEIFEILHLENDFYKLLVRKWLHQTVSLLFNDTKKNLNNEGVLTFQGKQGIGKSQFFRLLSIEAEWFGDGLTIDLRDKDSLIRATSRWITEIGEADATINKRQDSLKSFLSAFEDDIRVPYGRDSIRRPRTTSFCASVNPVDFLKDPTGNRRFWVIPITKIENQKLRDYGKYWIIQLWLQVYAEVKNDPDFFRIINQKEKEELIKNNLRFTSFLPCE